MLVHGFGPANAVQPRSRTRPVTSAFGCLASPASAVAKFHRRPSPSPKGYAAVLYGLLILKEGTELFHLIALVVIASIVAHSATDILVARWFDRNTRRAGATAVIHPTQSQPPGRSAQAASTSNQTTLPP